MYNMLKKNIYTIYIYILYIYYIYILYIYIHSEAGSGLSSCLVITAMVTILGTAIKVIVLAGIFKYSVMVTTIKTKLEYSRGVLGPW